MTDYVGDRPRPGRIGRQFPASTGIIGKALREKRVFVGRHINDDYEKYIGELVRNRNYTEEGARKLDPGVMEWMAVPFYGTDPQRVEGCFSIRPHEDSLLPTGRNTCSQP